MKSNNQYTKELNITATGAEYTISGKGLQLERAVFDSIPRGCSPEVISIKKSDISQLIVKDSGIYMIELHNNKIKSIDLSGLEGTTIEIKDHLGECDLNISNSYDIDLIIRSSQINRLTLKNTEISCELTDIVNSHIKSYSMDEKSSMPDALKYSLERIQN